MQSDHMDLTVVRYERRTPLHQKALYVVAVIAIVVIWLTRN